MTHIRDIFDSVSLSVIQFLESHKGVTNVQFFEIGGTSPDDIATWEKTNAPYTLPTDFKSFLRISDGLLLRWNIKLNNEAIPLGNMHLNSLETIKRVKVTLDQFLPPKPFSKGSGGTTAEHTHDFTAFALDSASDGNVCFIYKNKQFDNPEVWFQDLACKWHFMSEGFTEYFRLMIVHMGLPHWQYAFTDIGLDPITKVWFQFLSPERLEMDLKYHRKLVKWHSKLEQNGGSSSAGQLYSPSNFSQQRKTKTEDNDSADDLSSDDEDSEEDDETWVYKPQKLNLKKVNQILQRHQSANPGASGASGSNSQASSARDSKKPATKRSTSSTSLSNTKRLGKTTKLKQ